ncbi:unnamed protein product [Calypogeia fissa]
MAVAGVEMLGTGKDREGDGGRDLWVLGEELKKNRGESDDSGLDGSSGRWRWRMGRQERLRGTSKGGINEERRMAYQSIGR